MIKLTYKEYKVKESALEKFHNITEQAQVELEAWNSELEKQRVANENYYEPKPYIPTFEFEDDDYEVTTGPYRIDKEDIKRYKVNIDGDVEIYTSWGTIISIEENIEHLDGIFFGD